MRKILNVPFRALCVFILFMMVMLLSLPQNADAVAKKGFEALQVLVPRVTIEPGKTLDVMLTFQNIGKSTWKNSGAGSVSIYTQSPKYRASNFRAANWIDFTQAALLKEKSVAPGSEGTIVLSLKAPLSKGTYKETFQLVAEDVAWIPGGEFTLEIVVADKTTMTTPITTPTTTTATPAVTPGAVDTGLSAMILLRSAKTVTAEAGQEIFYRIGVKNTGTVTWNTREIRTSDIALAGVNTRNSSLPSDTRLAVKTDDPVKPGSVDFLDFKFIAPLTKGKHTIRYRMAVNDTVIPDFFFDIPVEVTTGSPEAFAAPLTQTPEGVTDTAPLVPIIEQPMIRIGVLIVDEETDWQVEVSCNTPWKLIDAEGGLLGEMAKDQMVRAFYKNQRYYFNRGGSVEQTHKYLRFVPDEKDAVCKIQNFDKRKTRRAGFAENTFRDVLELRYNAYKDRTWMINELPIDEYLYGLGETSNDSAQEYKKALVTAARTYAMYHYERGTKHAKEFFHLNSTADDQVYRGYEYEQRNPRIREAVDSTAGYIVTYNGATAITPYFSRSNGRTLDWSEVWGGSVEWIKSVPTPCDARKGRKRWGHGVGLSATEALCMAEEDGKKWDEILKYFFKNIELTKRWE